MQYKTQIIDDNLNSIIKGLNTAADIIISTMGGSGKNVIISKPERDVIGNTVNFTKDGVSVAKSIKLKDPVENIGASLLIDAANKTVQECGDGTTSTALFIKTLLNSKYLDTIEDKNEFLDNINLFLETLEQVLKEQSKKIESIDDIYRIAVTSCKSPSIANLIKEIYVKTGFKADISLELSKTSDTTYYELIEGLSFESGMVSSFLANQDNNTCILEQAVVLIEKELVNSPTLYKDILDECLEQDRSLLIIAPQFGEAFIRYIVHNKIQKGLKVCLVNTPGYGFYQKENIKDIMAFTTENCVNKVVVTQQNFTLYNTPYSDKIKKRVSQLEKLANNAVEDYEEEDYLNRITRLQQTGAVIYVGGVTEKNAKEEFDRIEDALGAVKAALRLGYVRGAGVELIQIIPLFKDNPIFPLIKELLSKPHEQILKNANIIRELKTDVPFNVRTKKYDENIIDPTDVILNSLKNSVSLFKLLINTSFIVYNE